jgi:hypothetical protein
LFGHPIPSLLETVGKHRTLLIFIVVLMDSERISEKPNREKNLADEKSLEVGLLVTVKLDFEKSAWFKHGDQIACNP